MKNGLKWTLVIIAVLVVAAGLFGMGFLHHTQMMANFPQSGAPGFMRGDNFHGQMMSPQRNGPMHGMQGFARGRGHFSGGMFGGIIHLALMGLLLYGVYRFGKKHSAPAAAPATGAVPMLTSHPCPACANAVYDGWKHCPNCGEKQT